MIRPLSTAVCIAALLGYAAADTASDLTAALASDPSLSSMQQLIAQHPTLLNDLVKDNTAVTIFVPNNDALQAHTATAGRPLTDTPAALLASILAYHVVAAGLTSASFDSTFNSAKGITAPTLLTGEVYNNRTATPELVAAYGTSAGGQVVYAERDDGGYTLQGGQADRINLTIVDRQWRRGYIQIVDRVLQLPKNCTATMNEQASLKTLSTSLADTGAYDSIDTARDVTCLAPSNEAFENAGNPQKKLNSTELTWLIRSHVLKQPLYLDLIRDGMVFQSLRNTTIKVTKKGDDIYFNNARVVQPNVLTNNGVVYVLDKVLENNSAVSPTTPDDPSGTDSAPSSTSSKSWGCGRPDVGKALLFATALGTVWAHFT